MRRREIDSRKHALLARRAELLRLQEAQGEDETTLVANRAADPLDLSANQREAAALERLSAREQHQVAEINAALARIDAGTYGECAACGAAVPGARLRAVPEARLCAACAQDAETRSPTPAAAALVTPRSF